jgi:hypothetical protein
MRSTRSEKECGKYASSRGRRGEARPEEEEEEEEEEEDQRCSRRRRIVVSFLNLYIYIE